MTLPLLILRPQEAAERTVARAKALGLSVIADPLFRVEPLDWTLPDHLGCDALMITSSNAIRHGGPQLEQVRNLPVLAVGEATADAARAAGFRVAIVGTGGVDALWDAASGKGYHRILRLTGAHFVKTNPSPAALTIRQVYRSRACPLGKQALRVLSSGAVILLYSPRAAKILTDRMQAAQLDPSSSAIAALSPNVARAAGDGWGAVETADRPSEDALLSLAVRLCKDK